MSDPITKFCVDCKFCEVKKENPESSQCGHAFLISPVTGKSTLGCATERSSPTSDVYPCGKEGALFEPK